MRICAKPWTTKSCLKETKSIDLERIGHSFITLTFHFEEVVTENLWDSAILYPKLLAVEKEQAQKLV